MFKKFKDKLAVEMKQSPARLQASMQQFAQAVVSPALSNSSIQELSASNDNFSLTEEGDETPKNSPGKHGFHNVDLISPISNSMGISRRSSISSATSDTSSLFPMYESPSNLYHLQSDMDQSASEIDENISLQLDKVTKDQLYSVYRKVQAKYHKYRGRYTDLVLHYREMERVKGKLESVLVETQDKVLRRIADLKEQCQLEQQAKAHLEEALRNDIEEKDHIINTLNTKIKLLQTNGQNLGSAALDCAANDQGTDSKHNLIDLTIESPSNYNDNALSAENVQLKEKLKKLENLILKYKDSLKRNKEKFTETVKEKSTVEAEYEILKSSNRESLKVLEGELFTAHSEIKNLTDQINTLKKREEESVISLAENKLSIHRELEDKEEQIKRLQLDLKHMTETKDNFNETLERYKTELEKMKLLHSSQIVDLEKKEVIPDISRGKSENVKLMQEKLDLEEKVNYHEVFDRTKEMGIEASDKESITARFDDKEALENLKSELNVKDTELMNARSKLEKLQKVSEVYQCERDKLHAELSNCKLKCKELRNEQDAQKIVAEEKKKEAEATIEKLQATVQSVDKELENMRGALMDRDKVCESFNMKVQEYAGSLEKAKSKLLAQETEIKNLKEKIHDNSEVSKLQDELERKSIEFVELHDQLQECESSISHLNGKIQENHNAMELLYKEKITLITTILSYKNSIQRLREDCLCIKSNIRKQVLDQNNELSVLNRTIVALLARLEDNNTTRDNRLEHSHGNLQEFEELAQKYTGLKAQLTGTVELKSALETVLKKSSEQLSEMSIKLNLQDQLNVQNRKLIAEIDNLNFKLYDVEKLQQELKILKNECKFLNEQLDNVNSTNEALSRELFNFKAQSEEASKWKMELEEMKEMPMEADKTVASLKSAGMDYSALDQEIQCLRSEVKYLNGDLLRRNDDIINLNEELNSKDICIENLQIECESQRGSIGEYIEKIVKLEKDFKILSDGHEKQIADSTETIKTLQKAINTKLVQLKKLNIIKERQDKTIQELSDELNVGKNQNTEALKRLTLLQNEMETLKSEACQVLTLKQENFVIALELQELKSAKEKVAIENSNLQDKENELMKENQELKKCSEALNLKIVNYETHNQQLLDDNTKLHNDIKLLGNQLSEQDSVIRSLKKQLHEQIRDVEAQRIQLAAVSAELQSARVELRSQTESLTLCKEEAEDVKDGLVSQNKELRDEVLKLNLALKDSKSIEEQNKGLVADMEILRKSITQLKAVEEENSKLKIEVSRLSDKVISLEGVQLENSKLVGKEISLRDKIAEFENVESDNVKLKSYINIVEAKISKLEQTKSENVELKMELDTLKASKDSENTELMYQIKNLNADNERLANELSELKLTIDEKVAELKLLDTRNSDLLKEIERFKNLTSAMDERINEVGVLKAVVKNLEEKVIKLRSDAEALRDSNLELQKEVQGAYRNKTADISLIEETDKLQEENKKLEAQLDEVLITFQAKELQMQIINDELKGQADKLKEDLKTNEDEQSMRLKQLVKEFQAQLHDKEEELQAALEKRFDRQQNYESNLIQLYKEQLKDFQIELTAKSEQIENLILDNKELTMQKDKDIEQLIESIALIKKEHTDEIKEIERKWKTIMQQRTDKLEAKHEEEINELTREWRNERRPDIKTDTAAQELESTSRVAMATVQSNTGSFHTLQQTLTAQKRELTELRKFVKLRYDTLEDSTEIEYLRNILFEYMMGRETMVLARVIAAVVKFDQEQTAKILKKEEDKLTLEVTRVMGE